MNTKIMGKTFKFIAIVSIICGIICFFLNIGTNVSDVVYGGDAYTGIQNATAQTANNILILNKNIKLISGFFFVILGLILRAVGNFLLTIDKDTKITDPSDKISESNTQE